MPLAAHHDSGCEILYWIAQLMMNQWSSIPRYSPNPLWSPTRSSLALRPFSPRNSINLSLFSLFSLQETLRDASRTLYTALDGKVYFKQVTVVVPDGWTSARCRARVQEPTEGISFQVRWIWYFNGSIHRFKRIKLMGWQALFIEN